LSEPLRASTVKLKSTLIPNRATATNRITPGSVAAPDLPTAERANVTMAFALVAPAPLVSRPISTTMLIPSTAALPMVSK